MGSKRWRRCFQAAKVAAAHSNAKSQGKKIGAAIFAKGKLLSFGFNVYGHTHPSANTNDKFDRNIHAEHKAILKRQYYVNTGLVLYTYRETSDGKPACSKPCANCQAIIREAGIKTVRYIDENGNMAEMVV